MRSSKTPFFFSVLLLLLVSCRGGDGDTAKLFQQITVLSEEVRTTNGEVRLLRQEVDHLRKELAVQTGISPESATAKTPGGQPAACPLPSLEADGSAKSGPPVHVANQGEPEPRPGQRP